MPDISRYDKDPGALDGAYVHEQALAAMTETLTRKGWSVTSSYPYRTGRLIVKER